MSSTAADSRPLITINDGAVIALRPYREGQDDGIVYGPWMAQIRGLPPFRAMRPEVFTDYRDTISDLLDRCGAVVAVDPEDDHRAYGWICGEHKDGEQVLHFLYVRNAFRRYGIGKTLLRCQFPEFGKRVLYYTHPTRAMRHRSEPWRAIYNPFLI